jgi:hypothetical protein
MSGIGFGQVFNNGVKYIKISRYDSGGLDRSNYLEQLQTITLTYPDRLPVEYPIITIQEQNDYYLYGITPTNATSSKGDIKNYNLWANSFTTDTQPTDDLIIKIGGFTEYTDPLNYFNPTTGVYTFGNTSNADILLTLSIGLTDPETYHYVYKNLTGTSYDLPALTSSLAPLLIGQIKGAGDLFIHLTGSKALKKGETLAIYQRNIDASPATGQITWYLDNDPPTLSFNGSSSAVIFNPDAPNFDFNDYNPLIDNAEIPQVSTFYMDVDYSQNPLTPVNFGLIISGTADRASVQDSNYTSYAWYSSRYRGSKNNSVKF